MIILKIQGGLGNQMFEYAFGRAVQLKLGDVLLLDTSEFAYDEQRDYSLNHFCLGNNQVEDDSGKYNSRYDQRANKMLKLGGKLCSGLQYVLLSKFGYYIWDYAKYKKVKVNRHRTVYLHGYWQAYDYFSDIIDTIREELRVKEPPQVCNMEMLSEIRNSNSVCVHVRRGDFLLSSNKLCNCSVEYYISAMEYLESIDDNLVFYIFSDDIIDVKKNFSFGKHNVIFVEQRNPDYEELRLMYNCKHFIIANSTFSWWAAVLAKRKGKKVVAPLVWYTDHRDVSHLLLQDWNIIENKMGE